MLPICTHIILQKKHLGLCFQLIWRKFCDTSLNPKFERLPLLNHRVVGPSHLGYLCKKKILIFSILITLPKWQLCHRIIENIEGDFFEFIG